MLGKPDHSGTPTTTSPAGADRSGRWEQKRLLSVLTLLESSIRDLPEQVCITTEVTHMPPVHFVRADIKVLITERLQPDELGVDFSLAGHEGV